MLYGICNQSIVPIKVTPQDTSEQVSQVLYGEHFKVLEKRKSWSLIKLSFDGFQGWIDNKQYTEVTQHQYQNICNTVNLLSANLVEYVIDQQKRPLTIILGSTISNASLLNHTFEGSYTSFQKKTRKDLIDFALLYINSPYLWGGKTPFGIDASGFTQMVYKLCGYSLLRTPKLQSTQGEALSFIEESEPGDLAFFDDSDGNIVHVGIIMENNYVIHVHGNVRIDRIDHTGIFNTTTKLYSHQLRVIKKIIT